MRHFTTLFLLLFTAFASANECPQHFHGGEAPKASEKVTILCKNSFAIGYSEDKKTPLWIAMKLVKEEQLSNQEVSRFPFKPDPTLPASSQPTLADYAGSGFDRGHMAAFEDMNHSPEAAKESMYLTNMVPQYPSINRGIWKALETRTRNEAISNGVIYVITGPVFEESVTTFLGTSDVKIPISFYKIVIDPIHKTTKTYIIPNVPFGVSTSELEIYKTTRSEAEAVTFIQFMPSIDFVDLR